MSDKMHMQVTIAAPPTVVFKTLTNSTALTAWFAEYAEVSLAEKRYDFWGRLPRKRRIGNRVAIPCWRWSLTTA